jgi:phosphoribosylanthranilate isomerase
MNASSTQTTLPKVKVCGLAREVDVQCALAAGADALGVVQYPPSPRSVEANQVAEWFAPLQGIHLVAVMVDLDPQTAATWANAAHANTVQLCGAESPCDWCDFPMPIWRRIGVDRKGLQEMQTWQEVAAGFVLDHPSSAGGSGQTVDFELAAQFCQRAPCLLAGGLHAGNVASAIRAVAPAGVDASSRLEAMPGRKNPAEVLTFVQNSQAAFAAAQS